MSLKEKYQAIIDSDIDKTSIEAQIQYLTSNFKEIAFSTSFSLEDQLITHFISNKSVKFFTLDTGRLFEETYETWSLTLAKYKIKINAFAPEQQLLENFISDYGPDSFYQAVESRKQCCTIRKVLPLKKALKGQQIWITGLRAEHSSSRENLEIFEFDDDNNIIKYNPLLHWTTNEVRAEIKKFGIPYNKLHDKGYVSIGCEPCTRAIQKGEDFRAGRWWWEVQSKKECGLHVKN